MKKLLLTISALVVAIAIFIIAQKNVADDISVTSQEEIAQNDTASNQKSTLSTNTDNWNTYSPITNINVIFPAHWHHIQSDSRSGFISNRNYSRSSVDNSQPIPLNKDEVRMYVSFAPADISRNEDLDIALSEITKEHSNDIYWSCRNRDHKTEDNCNKYKNVCSSHINTSDILKYKYVTIQCVYNKEVDSNKNNLQYISTRELIFQRNGGISMAKISMISYNKQLIDENLLDIIFEDFRGQVLRKYSTNEN